MSYSVYLGNILLPVTPAAISVRHRGGNVHTALLDGGEFSALRAGEGAEISVDFCLPRRKYPFANSFWEPEFYLDRLLTQRSACSPFRFICARVLPDGTLLPDTNLRVCLEELEVEEQAEDGDDLTVHVTLREYREYAAVKVSLEGGDEIRVAAQSGVEREMDNRPRYSAYTVVTGDCLWNIAKQFLGDGDRYGEIYALNRERISNPNRLASGLVLTMPEI